MHLYFTFNRHALYMYNKGKGIMLHKLRLGIPSSLVPRPLQILSHMQLWKTIGRRPCTINITDWKSWNRFRNCENAALQVPRRFCWQLREFTSTKSLTNDVWVMAWVWSYTLMSLIIWTIPFSSEVVSRNVLYKNWLNWLRFNLLGWTTSYRVCIFPSPNLLALFWSSKTSTVTVRKNNYC